MPPDLPARRQRAEADRRADAEARGRRVVLAVAVLAAVAAGFGAGWALGRSSAPTVAEGVAEAQGHARRAAEALRSLAGTDREADRARLARADTELQTALETAPWIASDQRATVLAAVDEAREAVAREVPADVRSAAQVAAVTLETVFGLEGA